MVNSIKDGETYNTLELTSVFGFRGKNAHKSCKTFLRKRGVWMDGPSTIDGVKWCAGEDIRRGLRMGPPGPEDGAVDDEE